MRKIILASILAIAALVAPGPFAASPGLAQAPPPVPALPDAERRTAYAISSQTGPFGVGFQLYGDGADYSNWVEVWLNGVMLTPGTQWTLSLTSGTIATAARPLTNAQITLVTSSTGNLQIVGARRPRRLSQFAENQGITARNLNVAITDLVAQNRETWDKINDVTGRTIVAPPGETLLPLPAAAARASMAPCFDAAGSLIVCSTTSIGFSVGMDIGAIHMYPSSALASPWPVVGAYGAPISTTGSTTIGLQEAINAAYQQLGQRGYDLNITGGDESTGGALVINSTTTVTLPPAQGKRTRLGAVTLNWGGSIGASPGIIIGSSMMHNLSMDGAQCVYQGTGSTLAFRPNNGGLPVPLDLLPTIVDSKFSIHTCGGFRMDFSAVGNSGITNSIIENVEINNGQITGVAGIRVDQLPAGANFAANKISSRHIHDIAAAGTAIQIGTGAPAGGQFFGANIWEVAVSNATGTSTCIDTYASYDFVVAHCFDQTGASIPINFRSGANKNVVILPYASGLDSQIVWGGTGNVVIGNGDIKIDNSSVAVLKPSGGLGISTTSDPGAGMLYTNSAAFMIRSKATYSNGAAAAGGTLLNAPAAGNPTKWIPVDDNGTTRYVPAW